MTLKMKVDKKFLHPHGIAPPLKNCRKRRFRKTLKKKYVEAPEIEKEVSTEIYLRGIFMSRDHPYVRRLPALPRLLLS